MRHVRVSLWSNSHDVPAGRRGDADNKRQDRKISEKRTQTGGRIQNELELSDRAEGVPQWTGRSHVTEF